MLLQSKLMAKVLEKESKKHTRTLFVKKREQIENVRKNCGQKWVRAVFFALPHGFVGSEGVINKQIYIFHTR